ncbi:PEP/pyruvate-binding domain-containing protein [Microbacterium trichothecenolyticum]|uniref:Phosphoenolpyruvate synthase n=1 Tax=Microbacterium trichothecenolyticum TaxID=69370 RepID=A0A0M2HED1_MICTR|nr:PEP/pyruvate-binding domain-containing protein [Microbacterium trichothecenolyticum]KJL42563.1 Phosphoenolpyruvate synthase [Microbacterium trichothecenolyticum]
MAASSPAPQGSFVVDLAELSVADLATVGGKAANLGELIRAGFDVPPGFCVTTAAYRRAVRGSAVESGTITDAAAARAAVLEAPFPYEVARAVREAYDRLAPRAGAVAVRSSATAEDLPGASFAGQQDTYLDVAGVDDVLDAVHRCWASLWTDRAVAYRAAQGIEGAGVALAVVVQRMVDAESAGVLFTADPVTGRRRQAVLDAARGLGEAVVSGSVDPDHFVVDTATGRILDRRPGGEADQPASVTDAQVRALAALGDRVERAFGSPQDIEWAIDGDGHAWLTQSRPVTTLFPVPVRDAPRPATDTRVYFCVSLAQGLHRPITPMGIAAFRVIGSGFLDLIGRRPARIVDGPGAFAIGGERIFVDATPVVRSAVGREIFPRALDVMEARSAVVLRGLFDDPRFTVLPRSRRRFARGFLHLAARIRLPLLLGQAFFSPAAAQRRVQRLAAEVRARDIAGGDIPTRVDGVVDLLLRTMPLAPRSLPGAVVGFGMLGLAARLLRGSTQPGDLQTVLRSVPDNVTTQMDLELWDVAVRARRDAESAAALRTRDAEDLADAYLAGALPAVLQRAMANFLARYGHRAVAEIDLGMPRWAEDPTHLFGVLTGYLRLDTDAATPAQHFAAGARDAEAMIDTLVHRARERSRLRAAAAGFCLRRARALVGMREMPKFLMIIAMRRARAELVAIGVELAAAGRVADPADVFFLDFDETNRAAAGTDMRATVRERRDRYNAELRRRHVPRMLLSDGTEPEAVGAGSAADQPGALRGTPASAGTATAPARVILDPVGAHLEPGEILVAPSTDPGWTPLFLTAGGLVMEMGGANSHGAVVAREYGIPAVVGVAHATETITTGVDVTVDGASGVVTVPLRSAGS